MVSLRTRLFLARENLALGRHVVFTCKQHTLNAGQKCGKHRRSLQTMSKSELWELNSSIISTDEALTCTHPHTSFQADFRDDGPERDFSLKGVWPHSFHTHLLSIGIWCWCLLLGTNYLVWIGWLWEIYRATFIGCQGHRCYVWSLKTEEDRWWD